MESLAINNWPTEILFSFFAVVDPFELRTFAQVCKRWSQMSVDNELWRRFCPARWDILPREKDNVKNWLIPMREGGLEKEHRINWNKIYLLRDLGENAVKALQYLEKYGHQTATKNSDIRNHEILCSEGFFTLKELSAFDQKLETLAITLINTDNIGIEEPLMALVNFHMELELHILSQVNISRLKHLNICPDFLRHYLEPLVTHCNDSLLTRVAHYTDKVCKLAIKKDLPIDSVASILRPCTNLYVGWRQTKVFDEDSLDIRQYISAIVNYIHNVKLGEAWQNFLSDVNYSTTSPTRKIETLLRSMSCALKQKVKDPFRWFEEALQQIEPPRKPITILRVIQSVAEGCKDSIRKNIPKFMNTYFFPYFKLSEDREMMISALCYCADLPNLLTNDLQTGFMDQPDRRIQFFASVFTNYYCSFLDEEKVLDPYLTPLLERLYRISDDVNFPLQQEAVTAITSLIVLSDNLFLKNKDSLMKQFKKLLASGDKQTRTSVMEALGRIGTALNPTNRASISVDMLQMYSQAVEDFKIDRTANEASIIKLTEFAVNSLGNKFEPFLAVVLPVIIDSARIPEDIRLQDSNNLDIAPDEMATVDKGPSPIRMATWAMYAIEQMLECLDTEVLWPHLVQIGILISRNLISPKVTPALLSSCIRSYTFFVVRHAVTTAEWAEQRMQIIRGGFQYISDIVLHCSSIYNKVEALDALDTIVTHLIKLSPDILSRKDCLDTFLAILPITISTFNSLECSFDEKKALAAQVIGYVTKILLRFKDNQLPAQKCTTVLLDMFYDMVPSSDVDADYVTDPNQLWVVIGIIYVLFNCFGNAIITSYNADKLKILRGFLAKHLTNDSPHIQEQLIRYYSVVMEQLPQIVPTEDNFPELVKWLEEKLVPEYRLIRPIVYDIALRTYMSAIYLHHHRLPQLRNSVALILTCLPPATNDWRLQLQTVPRLIHFISNRPDLITNQILPILKKGLQATFSYFDHAQTRDETEKSSARAVAQLLLVTLAKLL